jgi:uncharacterized protein YbjT (DUF2867 family)
MLIAITGGTGFLGGHLTEALLAGGHEVRILSRRPQGQDSIFVNHAKVGFCSLSLSDDVKLSEALAGCDAVAHLSGINREIKAGDFQDCHVQSTKHVLTAARKANLKKVIYISYLRARPDKISKYLQSKWDGEEVVREGELDYTIIKPGLCFGPRDQMIASIVQTLKLTPLWGFFASVGWLEKTVRPIYIGDMTRIMVSALTESALPRKTVAVVGPEELKLSEAVKRVGKVIGKPVVIVPTPALLQYALAWSMEQVMKYPIVSVPQIRMLAEGMSQSVGNVDPLPFELQPKTYFTEEQIALALKQIS